MPPATCQHLYTFGAVGAAFKVTPNLYDSMKTADVPYAADAELSLSFDELQVSLLLFWSLTI